MRERKAKQKTQMTYDTWKTTDPQDEELGPEPEQTSPISWNPFDEHPEQLEAWLKRNETAQS